MSPSLLRNASLLCAAVGVFSATSAQAHFSLELAKSYDSRDGTELKGAPCGLPNSPRGDHIYTFAPGQTITLSIVEYIQHPSYFRISFDPNGQHFKEPASIKPIDPTRPCPFNAADKCGESDFYNSATVLPNMDDLNPHMPVAGPAPTWTWSVKLPDVECDNCTLQILQVMEDTIHGAYNPVQGDPVDVPYTEDIYHSCIDIVLKNGGHGPDADGGPHVLPRVPFDGGTVTELSSTGTGTGTGGSTNGTSKSSGCAVTRAANPNSSSELAALGGGLALLVLRRRRARH